jgi:aminomethyltransferase
MGEPRKTPLHDLHQRLGGRIVDFAGWALPVQYPAGIIAEHKACRESAALFDVSHMGQVTLRDARGPEHAARALETLVPGGIASLKPGEARYTQFTSAEGGVLDDLIVSHAGNHLFLVVNASRADHDFALLKTLEHSGLAVDRLDRALIALQGPAAEAALAHLVPEAAALTFMRTTEAQWDGAEIRISRLGYTGEDGFEISVPTRKAEAFAEALLKDARVTPAGLGARDTLRLEAGLPLYGHELDETTSPVEAGLTFSIPKRRREAADFPGAARILRELAHGPARKLVGIRPDGAAPAREGTEVHADGRLIGRVVSGGFGPTVGGPVALAYVEPAHAAPDTPVDLMIRGAARPARVAALPFVPHRYKREA